MSLIILKAKNSSQRNRKACRKNQKKQIINPEREKLCLEQSKKEKLEQLNQKYWESYHDSQLYQPKPNILVDTRLENGVQVTYQTIFPNYLNLLRETANIPFDIIIHILELAGFTPRKISIRQNFQKIMYFPEEIPEFKMENGNVVSVFEDDLEESYPEEHIGMTEEEKFGVYKSLNLITSRKEIKIKNLIDYYY